jgi:hypothetical protein
MGSINPLKKRSGRHAAGLCWDGDNARLYLHLNFLTIRDASSIFWIGLAIVLVIALIGYLITRPASVDPSRLGEEVKVVHDRIPTGRIDLAGPSMDASAADTPASFYLKAEDIRLLVSFSGIERKEIR